MRDCTWRLIDERLQDAGDLGSPACCATCGRRLLEGLAEVDIAEGKAKLGDLEKKAGAAADAEAEIALQITARQGDVSGCAGSAESEHVLWVSSLGGGGAMKRTAPLQVRRSPRTSSEVHFFIGALAALPFFIMSLHMVISFFIMPYFGMVSFFMVSCA